MSTTTRAPQFVAAAHRERRVALAKGFLVTVIEAIAAMSTAFVILHWLRV